MELTENQSKKRKQEEAGQNIHFSDKHIYSNTVIGHIEIQSPNDDCHVYEAIHTNNEPNIEQSHSETNKGVCVRENRYVVHVSLAALAILFIANLGFSILLFLSKNNDGENGKWGIWGSWNQCSATCNTGLQTRNRTCLFPALIERGDYCDGVTTEYRLCGMTTCSGVNGVWNVWGTWNQCSASCNTGLQTRNRTCFFPAFTDRGDYCDGVTTEYRLCVMTTCSGVNGVWNVWGTWSQCSATCNTGLQTRTRLCFFPTLTDRGDYCEGDTTENKLCSMTACSGVNGNWSVWGSWSQCSVTCNTGLQTRNRTCLFPALTDKGDYCDGDATDYRLCSIACSVNGGWSSWSSWSSCSASCMKTRTRTCTSPAPSQQGLMCQGNSLDKDNCDLNTCSMSALSIRLVNGTSSRNGRVEVSLDGTTWGTVCDDYFQTGNAKVVCWMLGYSGSSYFTSNNTGNGSIFLDDVTCSGYESTLLDCKHGGWGKNNCNHSEDIGVTCD